MLDETKPDEMKPEETENLPADDEPMGEDEVEENLPSEKQADDTTEKAARNKKSESANNTQTEADPLAGIKKVAQVGQEAQQIRQNRWVQRGILGFIVVVVLAVMLWPSHPKKASNTNTSSLVNNSSVNSELAANMAQLEAASDQMKTQFVSAMHQVRNPNENRQMLARQNAPANLYTASEFPSQASVGSAGEKSNGNIFAGNGMNDRFGNQVSTVSVVRARTIPHPRDTIVSGEMMHAVLLTAINSDLPGMVSAIISQPVYAYIGQKPLIPAGSRLVGQYSSGVLQGQNRVMVIWERVILPDGTTVQINSPGTDRLGRAGMGANEVNTHFMARFGEASLLSLIGAGVATAGVSSSEGNNSSAQYRSGLAQAFQQSANNALQGTLPMGPTLHVYQGTEINVFVARDLSFYGVLHQSLDD